jgi:hypothetical protein
VLSILRFFGKGWLMKEVSGLQVSILHLLAVWGPFTAHTGAGRMLLENWQERVDIGFR